MSSGKSDDLTPLHLTWLVSARATNQRSALLLLTILERYPNCAKDKDVSELVQRLVSTCFSLWRAAFLADKSGLRAAAFSDAKLFLGKMLVDNAINYPQDRNAREWTFNYYMNNAGDSLLATAKHWPSVPEVLKERIPATKGSTKPRRRWDRHQGAFEHAIGCLEKELAKRKKVHK